MLKSGGAYSNHWTLEGHFWRPVWQTWKSFEFAGCNRACGCC